MSSVILHDISKFYDAGEAVVRGLNLEIADGEFLVLVGPSGCGKSTTLRMIAGLETISAGTLKIGDLVVNDMAPRDRDIAMVFQNYALYPHMSVEQNMAFALKMRKTPKAEIQQRVHWAAQLLDLEPLLQRKPGALSGGQRQRVALGRALVRKPSVFLFDEPLSNLDAKLRVQTRAELKQLHRQLGITTIYVTHDQEEAMTLGDRVAVMHEGVLRQCAPPLEVYQQPADRFVAGFLGMPPMNFVEGRLRGVRGERHFVGGDVTWRLPDAFGDRIGNRGNATAGFRPEACELFLDGSHGDRQNLLDATIQMVEPIGSTIDVFLQTRGGVPIVARVAAQPLSEGAHVKVCISADQVLLFAPTERGERLC